MRVSIMSFFNKDNNWREGHLVLPDGTKIFLCIIPDEPYHDAAVDKAFTELMKRLSEFYQNRHNPDDPIVWSENVTVDSDKKVH